MRFLHPGLVMSAEKIQFETESDLRLAMRGNLCRCIGYQAIVESIQQGRRMRDDSERMREESGGMKNENSVELRLKNRIRPGM